MTADALRRSPLQDRASELAELSASGDVTLAEIPFVGMLNLRVSPRAESAVEAVLACSLPGPLRAVVVDDISILWLGPDEFMVLAPDREPISLTVQLDQAIGSGTGSVVDVSANRATLELSGRRARDVLEKGIAIDLRPRAVAVDEPDRTWCAQTLLTSVPIILWHPNHEQWRILVRPSFANYVADWLIDAASEYVG